MGNVYQRSSVAAWRNGEKASGENQIAAAARSNVVTASERRDISGNEKAKTSSRRLYRNA